MAEAKKKKGSIREEDVLLLLNKYSPTAILNVLKEVAQFAGVKIDWNTLVKRSSTGISNAREYQMLWRHLAYQDPLLEKLEAGAEPLDDDSDLEFELEAFSDGSGETSAEAAACVKILISSGLTNETVEAPLPTDMSNGQAPCTASDKQLTRLNRGANTAVPVSLQKQPQAAPPSAEVFDGNGFSGAGGPAKKKRKLWTKEEDMELIAAVDKCGEGNWANILKGDFKHDRTASQLSQRWSIIRKRRANLSAGSSSNQTGSAPTEAHMATWQAVNMAIKMPIIGGLSARRPSSTGALQSTDSANASSPAAASEATAVSIPDVPNLPYQPNNLSSSQKGTSSPLNNSRANTKMSTITVKPLGGPNNIIQAAAFAAGGRLAPPSTAASHFKAAQSKNAVHIRPVRALPGSTMSSSKSSSSMTTIGPQTSNVHCIKTPPKDVTVIPGSRTLSQGICNSSAQLSPSGDAAPSNQPTEQVNIKASPPCTDMDGNAESRSSNGGLSKARILKSTEEIKLDSSVSHNKADLVSLDEDSNKKAGVDQIGDGKTSNWSQIAIEPEIALNMPDLSSEESSEAVVAVKAADDKTMKTTPAVLISEIAKDQFAVDGNDQTGDVAQIEMHHSGSSAGTTENGTLEQTSQNPTSGDRGAVEC